MNLRITAKSFPPKNAAPANESGSPCRNGGFHAMTSKRAGAIDENTSDVEVVTMSLFLSAFAFVHRTASGLMSTAVTLAPARAAHIATTPDPHPISRNVLPRSGRDDTKFARIEVEPKYFG